MRLAIADLPRLLACPARALLQRRAPTRDPAAQDATATPTRPAAKAARAERAAAFRRLTTKLPRL